MVCNTETVHEDGISLPYKVTGEVLLIVNDKELAKKVWKQTQNACPVIKLIKDAGIVVEIEALIKSIREESIAAD